MAAEEYRKAARSVSRKRLEAGRKLEKLVEAEINDLAMRASFRIAVEENEDDAHWTSSGINQVVYRISTNAGETMRPLEQIASGGELSRVMLALKASVEAGTNSAVIRLRRQRRSWRRSGRWSSTKSIPASEAARPRLWGKN